MPLDAIKAMPVADLAASDCMLLLWATWPCLREAFQVIEAWGFAYQTCGFNWVKETSKRNGFHWGMGYWTRANTEPVLLATRGKPKRLARDVHQLILEPVSSHSRKPDEVRRRIERLVRGPYLELFGRRAVTGWTVFGNEVGHLPFVDNTFRKADASLLRSPAAACSASTSKPSPRRGR